MAGMQAQGTIRELGWYAQPTNGGWLVTYSFTCSCDVNTLVATWFYDPRTGKATAREEWSREIDLTWRTIG